MSDQPTTNTKMELNLDQEMASVASEVTPVEPHTGLTKLFPTATPREDVKERITTDTLLYTLLVNTFGLPTEFVTTLNNNGITTPSRIVNKFGTENETVAKSLAQYATTFLFNKQQYQPLLNLFMYCRLTTLKGCISKKGKKGTWQSYEKGERFNEEFSKFGNEDMVNIKEKIGDTTLRHQARSQFTMIRNTVKNWIKQKQKDSKSVQSPKGSVTPKTGDNN